MHFPWIYTKNVYKREGYKQAKISYTQKFMMPIYLNRKIGGRREEGEKRLKGERRKERKKIICVKNINCND